MSLKNIGLEHPSIIKYYLYVYIYICNICVAIQ